MSRSPELATRAFDALASMRRCETPAQLDAVVRKAFADLGLEWFSLARFFAPDRTPATAVIQGVFEPGWSARYVDRQYSGSSLIARQLLTRSNSYSWTEIVREGPRNPVQDRIFGEAREHGLRDGLFLPVRWTDHSYAAVVTAGLHPDMADPLLRMMAEVISSFYAAECRRILASAAASPVALSPRQRDCIAWVRHGKSSTDIAQILGISSQTVEDHIAEACRKLGVRTRTQAAVEASLRGLI